jgi:hypothetical protein
METAKARSSFFKKAWDGQRISILWPTEANPPRGWEQDEKNWRTGRLKIAKFIRQRTCVVMDNGTEVELPASGFRYEVREDKK